MSQGSPEVIPFDLARMFLGDTSPLFLLEIAFRTALMFLWLVFLLRVTGKRGLAQLSPLELASVIGPGSAAGDPHVVLPGSLPAARHAGPGPHRRLPTAAVLPGHPQ